MKQSSNSKTSVLPSPPPPVPDAVVEPTLQPKQTPTAPLPSSKHHRRSPAAKMSSASYTSDPRYAKAARLAAINPNLSVPKAMRAEGFNDEEVKDNTKLRRVRRMAARVPLVVAPKEASIDDVSPLTDDDGDNAKLNSKKRLFTENSNNPMTKSMTVPEVKRIRKTTKQT